MLECVWPNVSVFLVWLGEQNFASKWMNNWMLVAFWCLFWYVFEARFSVIYVVTALCNISQLWNSISKGWVNNEWKELSGCLTTWRTFSNLYKQESKYRLLTDLLQRHHFRFTECKCTLKDSFCGCLSRNILIWRTHLFATKSKILFGKHWKKKKH